MNNGEISDDFGGVSCAKIPCVGSGLISSWFDDPLGRLAKLLALALEMIPSANKIGLLVNPGNPIQSVFQRSLEVAARANFFTTASRQASPHGSLRGGPGPHSTSCADAIGIFYCCGAGSRHADAGAFLVSASLLRRYGLFPGRLRSVGGEARGRPRRVSAAVQPDSAVLHFYASKEGKITVSFSKWDANNVTLGDQAVRAVVGASGASRAGIVEGGR